ncbi:hypothetical protein AVEN_80114-1 [Araneus ventricosus]|uniref:Mos1 transposase HTH domain-containing protein n=1 Tax=Araneus ventricosus TaxID=182803 RepID=A0A4Y2SBY4_ARAVE|nr:hypothetical protein AVEN_80114-1 [Araneus ventricosus]
MYDACPESKYRFLLPPPQRWCRSFAHMHTCLWLIVCPLTPLQPDCVAADCEVRSVIRVLNANNVKQTEIHRQLVEIYGENVMTDGMVRKWVRQFDDERTNVHDEARSGRPSVVNDGLVAKVNEKIRENRWFTIRMLCDEFPQISKTVLHENVTNRLNYRKR